MSEQRFMAEAKAYESLTKLVELAREVRVQFEAAGVPLPPMLARMYGSDTGGNAYEPRISVSAPKPPPRPTIAREDWIWVRAPDLTETTLVLCALRAAGSLTTAGVVDAVKQVRPAAVTGTLYNVVARLRDGMVLQSEGGSLRLADIDKAPILHEGAAWGPIPLFQKTEIAAYRRELIVHVLRANKDGLMAMQLVRQLESPDVCRVPSGKDLIKLDLETLKREGKVQKISNSRKWRAVHRPNLEDET